METRCQVCGFAVGACFAVCQPSVFSPLSAQGSAAPFSGFPEKHGGPKGPKGILRGPGPGRARAVPNATRHAAFRPAGSLIFAFHSTPSPFAIRSSFRTAS